MATTTYHTDVSDAAFAAFLPASLPDVEFASATPGASAPTLGLPANAISSRVAELTAAINAGAAADAARTGSEPREYAAVRVEPGATVFDFERSRALTTAEIWYHRSGAAHGKVVRAQWAVTPEPPFIALLAARVVRRESEDRIVLLSGGTEPLLSGGDAQ